ncbi:MAG: hypothetical protein ABEJ23_05165 [Haloarculaceae archaeon]
MGFGTNRTTLLACTVAALLVLAGCNAGPMGDGSSAAYTDSGAALNGTTLRHDHVERLSAAGSFTTTVALQLDSGDGPARFSQTTAVNRTGDRALQTSRVTAGGSVGHLESATYTADGVTYERLAFGTGDSATVRYRRGAGDATGDPRPVNVSGATSADLVRQVAERINWTQTGVVERNGTTLTRYAASGRENFTDFRRGADLQPLDGLNESAAGASLDDVNATLLVTPDGLVREFHFAFSGTRDGTPVTLQFTVRITDVGSTDAAPPDWLGEARAQTGN